MISFNGNSQSSSLYTVSDCGGGVGGNGNGNGSGGSGSNHK